MGKNPNASLFVIDQKNIYTVEDSPQLAAWSFNPIITKDFPMTWFLSDVMQRFYTVEQLQHLFFIPAVEEEIFYKAVVPAELVDHQIYRFPEIKGVEVANRYDRIIF